MISTNRTTVPIRVSQCLAATALMAGLALGASAFGDPGVAEAAPEWDIGAYDKCVGQADLDLIDGKISPAVHEERIRNCCADTGGISIPGVPAADACRAPAANAPARTIPPGLSNITQTLEPAAPAPASTRPTITLAPASAG